MTGQLALYAEPNTTTATRGAGRRDSDPSLPRSPGEGAGPDAAPAPSLERFGWRRVSDYCITNGTHNICRIVAGGEETFEVWVPRGKARLTKFATAEEARAWCAPARPVERSFSDLRQALEVNA